VTRAHVIGAGLAGLSASIALARAGYEVSLSEAAPQAGGRCRSYHDPQLGSMIDNGNHLVLSGNSAVMRYLAAIGASDRLAGPDEARFVFADLQYGRRWTIAANGGRIPWWIFAKDRRVPGTRPVDYLELLRLLRATGDHRVGEVISTHGALWDRLLDPFLIAALNTPSANGSARLAAAVVRETLAKGGDAYRPRIATPTLAAAFVEPALAWLERRGIAVRLRRRLRAIGFDKGRVASLDFGEGEIDAVAPGEPVILAVPSWVASTLLPGLAVPTEYHAIVNAHFRIAPPAGAEPMTGVLGATAEWIFAFADRLSVTISAADRLVAEDRPALAARIWRDVAAVHGLSPEALPPWQIVIEKRATFAATPEQDRLRPDAKTAWANLFLAGDWTQTGLPATIEGAIRSGETAAAAVRNVD
jgi:squalene-associated FAD-dependent desaturase